HFRTANASRPCAIAEIRRTAFSPFVNARAYSVFNFANNFRYPQIPTLRFPPCRAILSRRLLWEPVMYRILLICAALFCCTAIAGPVSLPNTAVVYLQSKTNDVEYKLYISYPR